MPNANFFLEDDEHQKVIRFAHRWDVPAYQAIKRMIREYPEDEEATIIEN